MAFRNRSGKRRLSATAPAVHRDDPRTIDELAT
jgi:hypothetical protein